MMAVYGQYIELLARAGRFFPRLRRLLPVRGVPLSSFAPFAPSCETSSAVVVTSFAVSIDALGNASTRKSYLNRDAHATASVSTTPSSTLPSCSISVGGLSLTNCTSAGIVSSREYDALGRAVASTDGRGNTTTYEYDAYGRIVAESRANGASFPFRTTFGYDSLGRRIAVTNALGQVTHTAYDAEGRTVATWGVTYPVAYEYDAHGRMTAMATTRDPAYAGQNLWDLLGYDLFLIDTDDPDYPSELDTTLWSYDLSTGLMTGKTYADGQGPSYTYTPDGQLATRTWARGVTTSYTYTNGASLAAIDYSDSTPDVTFQYDRLGRMVSAVVTGISTNAYAYDPDTLALSVETQNGMEINRTTDDFGRDTGFSLDGTDYTVTYGYDAYGRFQSVTSAQSAVTFTYSYLPNTDLISGMTASSGFLWTRAYESVRSLITSVENRYGETVISRYDYDNDALGRRTSRADSGTAFAAQPTYGDSATVEMPAYNAYSYNIRSELTGAARRWGTPGASGELVLGQQYAYEFDSIGNRTTAAEGETSRTASYTANALNQYTQRTVPDEKDLIGTAPTNVAVTVNQNPVSRQNAYWHHALEVPNAASAAYPQVAITAVYNPPGTNDPDVVTSQTGRVFVAQTPEAFTYDHDGNLTQDGRFTYTWDAENRLSCVTTRTDLFASVPRVRVEYVYDHQSRRIASATAVWTNDAWQATESRAFLYDDWNVVTELTHSQTHTLTNLYTRGLDLSGSLQGAGGIGGLLAASLDGVTALYCYDANGNVGQLSSPDGDLLAQYEYSPFGETIVSTGPLAKTNPFRFSTKWFDSDTGLGYWGYRWYSTGNGRWINRDPIGEKGGINLYVYVQNLPINTGDPSGLYSLYDCHTYKYDTKLEVAEGLWLGAGVEVSVKKCKCCCETGGAFKYKEVSANVFATVGVGFGVDAKVFGVGVNFMIKGPHVTLNALKLTYIYNECTNETDPYFIVSDSLEIAPGTTFSGEVGIGNVISFSGNMDAYFVLEQRLMVGLDSTTYEADISVAYNVGVEFMFLFEQHQWGKIGSEKISPTATISY